MVSTLRVLRANSGGEKVTLPDLVGAIGNAHFGAVLAQYLHSLCGADHFAAFRLGPDELSEVAACCVEPEHTARDLVESYVKQRLWKNDPALCEAQRRLEAGLPALIHVDFRDQGYKGLRAHLYPRIRDRILLCGRSTSGSYSLSVLREDPNSPFPDECLRKLGDCTDLLVAVVSKHSDLCRARPSVAQALTDLRSIETCITEMSDLPRREGEVCARILYGLSSIGIALDLSVSEETVKTYRKRAYQRLTIGSERELLTWYLAHWSRWNAQRFEACAGLFAPAGAQAVH